MSGVVRAIAVTRRHKSAASVIYFDLNDFKAQISQMKKMGGLSGLLDKLPAAIDLMARREKVLLDASRKLTVEESSN